MLKSLKRFWSAMSLGGLTVHEAGIRTWTRINDDAIVTRAAAISFYAFAALVPFLTLLIALTGQWLPWVARHLTGEPVSDLSEPLDDLLPPDAASFVAHELRRLQNEPPVGSISFGLFALVWLSSSVFLEIIDAMNFILGVMETRPFYKRRAMAIIMTLSEAAILAAAVITIVAWPQIVDLLELSQPAAILATAIHETIVFLTVLISFSLALFIAPNTRERCQWVTPGSVWGTIVLLASSLLFRAYVQYWGNYSATYGSLAGIVVLLTWLWLSSIVLLTAAELNKVVKDAASHNHRSHEGIHKLIREYSAEPKSC